MLSRRHEVGNDGRDRRDRETGGRAGLEYKRVRVQAVLVCRDIRDVGCVCCGGPGGTELIGVVVTIDLPASGDHGGGPFAGDRGRHGPRHLLRRGDLEVDRTGQVVTWYLVEDRTKRG